MRSVRFGICPGEPRPTGMRVLALIGLGLALCSSSAAQAQATTATPPSGSPPTGVAGAAAPAPGAAAPPAPAAVPNSSPEAAPTPPPSPAQQPNASPEAAPAPTPAAPAQPAPPPEAAPAPPPPAPPPAPATVAAPEPAQPAHRERVSRPAAVETETDEERGAWLYFRMAAGIGFPFGPDIADVYDGRNQRELQFSGYSLALDLMGGRALLPWLVLGLGITSDSVLSGTVKTEDHQERDLAASLYFAVIGGFIDVYTSPPAGLHFQALLGLAHLSRSEDLGQNTGNGFGAVLGVGYEFAVGNRWNLGLLGRIAFSSLSMDDVNGEELSPSLYEPSLLWTATFRPEAQ
jgi:hypothetical protein